MILVALWALWLLLSQLFDEKKTYYGPPRGWMLTFTSGLTEPIAPQLQVGTSAGFCILSFKTNNRYLGRKKGRPCCQNAELSLTEVWSMPLLYFVVQIVCMALSGESLATRQGSCHGCLVDS